MLGRFLGARTYGLVALGVVAFTLYGSYVPFHFHPRPWADATGAFRWAMENRLAMESRSDWVANCMLGMPLGFCCLAALRVDRPGRNTAAILGLLLLPLFFAFAAAVEFGQLYFPGRTCAGSDVWAQGLGSTFGVLVWILGGQWLTETVRGGFEQPGQKGSPAILLLGYLGFAMVVEFLPFDLSISPAVLYHRAKDPNIVTLIPLSELDYHPGRTEADDWKKVQNWLELIALSWPLGAIAARLPGRWRTIDGLPRIFGAGLAVSALLELGQLAVASRHPSTTDVAVLTFGMLVGWAASLALADRGVRKYRIRVALGLGVAWFGLLGIVHWHPFDFRPALLNERLGDLDWMPMAGQASKNYLWALDEVLSKFILFVPIGVLGIWVRRSSAVRPGVLMPMLVAGGAAAVLEFGQAMIPSRLASPTDVLFGLGGGWIGAEAARRIAGSMRRELVLQPQLASPGVKRRAAVLPRLREGNHG